jgi:hypothetical protein
VFMKIIFLDLALIVRSSCVDVCSRQTTSQSHADSRRQVVRVRHLRQEVHAAAAACPSSAGAHRRQAIRLSLLFLQVCHRREPPQALSRCPQAHLPAEETRRSRRSVRTERGRPAAGRVDDSRVSGERTAWRWHRRGRSERRRWRSGLRGPC